MPETTLLEWIPETKSIVLKCSDKMWEYLQDLKTKGLDNLNIIQLAKIYKELKSLDLKLDKKENEGNGKV